VGFPLTNPKWLKEFPQAFQKSQNKTAKFSGLGAALEVFVCGKRVQNSLQKNNTVSDANWTSEPGLNKESLWAGKSNLHT
jgi:hypothetical protein